MPLYTQAPGSTNLVFVHPKNGKFVIEAETGPVEYEMIEGTLDMVKIEHDEGNVQHKIQPYDAFIMHIRDEDTVYRIKINAERNFAFSVASVLSDLGKGDTIRAKTRQGDDPTVTFCNILKKDENGTWVRPVLSEMPKDKAKKIEFLKDVVEKHPAKFAPKPETE
jgi:hypothetical protein